MILTFAFNFKLSRYSLDRIAFLQERHPAAGLSVIVTVNTPAAKFATRFPDFADWTYSAEHNT